MPRAWDDSTFVFMSSRSRASLGRIERRMLAVIGELIRLGATVLVVCGPRSPLAEQAAALGATVAPYRLEAGNYLRAASRLRKYLRRYQPVCAHSTGQRADLVLRWAARDLSTAVINSIACGAWPRGGPLRRFFDAHTLHRPDVILVDCKTLIAELVALGAPLPRVRYDPPSVTVPHVMSEAERPVPDFGALALSQSGDGARLAGFASRLESVRGAAHLVDAAAVLAASGVDVRVVIAGRGPELEAVRKQAAGVGNVSVLGEVESLPSVLYALDVCVFPSVGGGAPTALLEAAVLGKPIVSTMTPGIEGLFIPAEEIVLVPPGDADAIARAVAELLADPDRARSMGERARQRALDEYSSASAVKRHLSVYREFMER
ncbi:MAG: glycosyltransferase family 4 protein [Clostridiales bacterium]|nr:glycosyltransferase family 4 protein [Clostridiales bacterium]